MNGGFAVRSAFLADGDDAGFIQNNALAAHVNKRVGRTEVNGEVIGEVIAKETEHFHEGWKGERRGGGIMRWGALPASILQTRQDVA